MRLLSAFVRRRQWGGEVYSCVGVFFEKIMLDNYQYPDDPHTLARGRHTISVKTAG